MTAAAAQDMGARLAQRGRLLSVLPSDSAWRELLATWGRSLTNRGLTSRTEKTYLVTGTNLARWCLTQGGLADPTRLRRTHLEEYIEHLTLRTNRYGRANTAAAIAKEVRGLKVLFKWVGPGYLDDDGYRDPMANVKIPRVAVKDPEVFTDTEVAALVAARKGRGFSERRDAALIRVLDTTGLRVGELVGLRVEDVDLDAMVLYVSRETSKGRKDRVVPLYPDTAEALEKYLTLVRRQHKDAALPQLWLTAHPHRGALGIDGVRLLLQRRAQLGCVEGPVNPHRFRHTNADRQHAAGLSSTDMQHLNGWTGSAMVDRYARSNAMRRAVAHARELQPVGGRR